MKMTNPKKNDQFFFKFSFHKQNTQKIYKLNQIELLSQIEVYIK